MPFIRPFILLAAVLALPACRSTNVVFADGQRAPHPDARVVSIVYDRYGSLYPSDRVHVDSAEMHTVHGNDHLRLAAYFRRERADSSASWQALIAEAPLRSPNAADSFPVAWNDVQTSLRARVVQRIERLALADSAVPRPLVVLVHGFNNDHREAREWYDSVRHMVRERQPQTVFLDVHWDGLVSGAVPLDIWTKAQYNFPLVGLEFRRVLNTLDPRIPVRILTHSSGGPLIASTLGDASCPLSNVDADYSRYLELVRDPAATAPECTIGAGADPAPGPRYEPALGEREAYRPPNPRDFRVAMIVPAASPNTFTRFTRGADGPDRLIFGINSEDIAVAKAIMPCTFRGSTCMAVRPDWFCSEVMEVFSGNPHTRAYVLDFKGSRRNRREYLFWDEHAMTAYMERDDMGRLLSLLLDDTADDPGEEAQVCGAAQNRSASR